MTNPTHFSPDNLYDDLLWPNSGLGSDTPPLGTDGLPATQTLFFSNADGTPDVSYTQIYQGDLGDCWVLSSFGDEAIMDPAAIPQMIYNNGNGTETVTLYVAANGRLPTFGTTSFEPVNVLVNNASFSPLGVNGVDSASQNVAGNTQAIWPQVLENAFAELNGGYAAIGNGGYPVVALEELTGMPAYSVSPNQLTFAGLIADLNADDLLVFDTADSRRALPDGLVSDHAYMLAGVNANGTVQLANPWGVDQPAPLAFSALASAGIADIEIGQQHRATTTTAVA